MQRRPSLRTIAITLVTLALPATLLVAYSVGAYLKSTNPDNVDITQGLAYLRPILISGWVTFGVIAASVCGLIVMMYRREGNFVQAKLPLTLLVILCVLLGILLVVNSYTNELHKEYRESNQHTGA